MENEVPKDETSVNMMSNEKTGVKSFVNQLETFLDEYMVKKAPFALPNGLKEFLAVIAPYSIIIVAVLAIPMILFALGLSSALAPIGMMGGYGYSWGITGGVIFLTTLAGIVLELMAVPGLFKRTKGAWRILFYVSIIQVVGNVVSLHIISALIGAIINWYILFQMKDVYKN